MKGSLDKVPLYVSKTTCITKSEKIHSAALLEVKKALAALASAGSNTLASTFLKNNDLTLQVLVSNKKTKRNKKQKKT